MHHTTKFRAISFPHWKVVTSKKGKEKTKPIQDTIPVNKMFGVSLTRTVLCYSLTVSPLTDSSKRKWHIYCCCRMFLVRPIRGGAAQKSQETMHVTWLFGLQFAEKFSNSLGDVDCVRIRDKESQEARIRGLFKEIWNFDIFFNIRKYYRWG